MGILIDANTRVLCQGFTGKQASMHCEQMIAYGTNIVAGVTPAKGGSKHLGRDVYSTVAEAASATQVDASVIFVPAAFCRDAIIEAIDAGIKLIICITEGVPVADMIITKKIADANAVRLIGPNCPGVITPGACKIGIMPGEIHRPGCVGIVSRSGTLTYEAVHQTSTNGLGQSTVVGIGGDCIPGSSFIDIIRMLEQDKQTEIIVLVGEIGGTGEAEAAEYISQNVKKPVLAYIAGISAPRGKRMGHAGAIISGVGASAAAKKEVLSSAGVQVVDTVTSIGLHAELLHKKIGAINTNKKP